MKLRSTKRSAKILGDFAGKLEPYKKVLDLGAKDGSLQMIVPYFNADYYPLDIETVEHPNFIRHNLNEPIPFKDGEFDYVFASMIVEHVFNPFSLIKEIDRVLKEDGVAIFALPDENSLISRIQAPFRKYEGLNEQFYGHHWSFTYRNGLELLEHFFKIEKVAGRFGITSKNLIGIAPAVLFKCTKSK